MSVEKNLIHLTLDLTQQSTYRILPTIGRALTVCAHQGAL